MITIWIIKMIKKMFKSIDFQIGNGKKEPLKLKKKREFIIVFGF